MPSVMTPAKAYRLLNKTVWQGRLPQTIALKVVPDAVMPTCDGLTIEYEDLITKPIILLNVTASNWKRTLVHEMLHVAEPRLEHGAIFNALVDKYYNLAKTRIKDFGTK